MLRIHLAEQIAKKRNLKLVSFWSKKEIVYWVNNITQEVIAKSNYANLLKLKLMVEIALDAKLSPFYPLIGLMNISYTIKDEFYQKLEGQFFEKDQIEIDQWNMPQTLPLNETSLFYNIDVKVTDAVEELIDKYKTTAKFKTSTFKEELKKYKQIYSKLTY